MIVTGKRMEHHARSYRRVVGIMLAVLGGPALAFTTLSASVAAPQTNLVTFQQVSSGRFMDAHEIDGEDFRLVTRPQQNDDTQRWRITQVGTGIFTIQQLSNGRHVDAHEIEGEDFRVVTRPQQNNDTQYWRISALGGGIYTIQQVSSGRFADAHEIAEQDFRMVTRPQQDDTTQQWRVVFLD
jgi:hypothetical protein